jgi:transposase-like protein
VPENSNENKYMPTTDTTITGQESTHTEGLVVYTTNPIEALNRQLRKAIKMKGHFPNEETARKQIYLLITNAILRVDTNPKLDGAAARRQIHFGDRLRE